MMNQRIVYQLPDEPASVFIPAPSVGIPLPEIGARVVPQGVPFWIVDASAIPTDRTLRAAWELDVDSMGSPDGVGGAA